MSITRPSREMVARSLFRQEAVQAALGTQIGEAFAGHWRGVRILTALSLALTAGLLLFIGVVEYSPAYRVPCYMDVQNGLVRLNAPADGQIVRLEAADGMRVKVGGLLAVLSTDKLREGGDTRHTAVRERLETERAAVEREINAASREADANRIVIGRRIAGLRLEEESARADNQLAEQLLSSLRAQVEQFSSLIAEGYVSKLQLAQKRDEVMLQESRVASTRSTLRRIQRDISMSEAEQKVIDARLNGFIENRRRDAADLERLAVQSDSDAEQVIRAPVEGIVSSALIVKGQSVKQGQTLFSVTPLNEPQVVRLLIPARAAAAVKPGMDIRFVLSAYPREKFGDFAARITSISLTPTLSSDIPQVIPVSEPAFMAVASLHKELHSLDGRRIWTKPGMIGEALVSLEHRTILEWLLDPLLRGLNGSSISPPHEGREELR
jgi:membrane fusion protein